MENKYYTPTIEEFHVGFEYEYLIPVTTYDEKWRFKIKKSTFISEQWTSVSANYNFEKDLEESKIRVKYLDCGDIESLGFTFKGDLYYYDNLELQQYNDYGLTIKHFDYINDEYRSVVSQITIKNKSELKKLLKQLKIIA